MPFKLRPTELVFVLSPPAPLPPPPFPSYVFDGWRGTASSTALSLDITLAVSSFGDHGMTSILWDRSSITGDAFLYITFMKNRWTYGNFTCNDYGQMDGRAQRDVDGCDVYGALSRWPIDDKTGRVSGPEQRLVDTQIGGADGRRACATFSTHSIPACIVKSPITNTFYISMGDGAGFTTVDAGNLGHNLCGDDAAYEGAFRAQNPMRWNGKILSLREEENFEPKIFTTGHRNPFRISFINEELYDIETGW